MAFSDSINNLANFIKTTQGDLANLRKVTSTIGGSPQPQPPAPSPAPMQYVAGIPMSNATIYGLGAVVLLLVALVVIRK